MPTALDAERVAHLAEALEPVLGHLVELVAQRTAELVLEHLRADGGARPAASPADSRLLDVEEAAAFLSLSPSTIYKLSSAGQLPRVKLGGRVRFRVQDLGGYAERHRDGQVKVIELAKQVRAGRR